MNVLDIFKDRESIIKRAKTSVYNIQINSLKGRPLVEATFTNKMYFPLYFNKLITTKTNRYCFVAQLLSIQI